MTILGRGRGRWGAALVVALTGLPLGGGLGCGERGVPHAASGGHSEPAVRMAEASGGGAAPEPGPARVSDLDRVEAELFAAVCEHHIAQHACDECRYELGLVKVDSTLLGAGGLLATVAAVERPLPATLDLDGEAQLDAGRAVRVASRVGGTVGELLVDVGARVARGQPLLTLTGAEWADELAAWRQARAGHALARATAEREAELHAKGICPRKDQLEAEAQREQAAAAEMSATERLRAHGLEVGELAALARDSAGAPPLTVRAPIAGVVLQRDVGLGQQVEAGELLLLVADVSRLWVLAHLPEHEIGPLLAARAAGEVPVEVTLHFAPGRALRGRLDAVSGTLDESTRTARARIVVENRDGLLRPGMFVHARLSLPGAGEGLAVPAEAVLGDEGRSFVFIVSRPPYFLRRPVTVGREADGWIEIVSGLAPGQVVAARGAFLLKSDVLRAKMGVGCAD